MPTDESTQTTASETTTTGPTGSGPGGSEPAAEEGRKPWFPAIIKDDGSAHPVDTLNFKTQVECDGWIKENIPEGEIIVSLRLGKKFKVTRKVSEV